MKSLGYYNGVIDELHNIQVPMLDRAYYFGDGVYDATYTRNHKAFALDEHIDRFFMGCKKLNLNFNYSKSQLTEIIEDCITRLDDDELFVYWQASRGTAPRQHEYDPYVNSNLCIMITPKKIRDLSKKLKLISCEDIRYEMCNIKTMNLIPNILALNKAIKWGCDECVFHRNGRVTECSSSNIAMLKGGNLIVPPADNLILDGIARKHLISCAKALNINVFERPFSLNQLLQADEVILTSSGSLCVQIESIDSLFVGGKDTLLLKKLQEYLLNEFLVYTNKE